MGLESHLKPLSFYRSCIGRGFGRPALLVTSNAPWTKRFSPRIVFVSVTARLGTRLRFSQRCAARMDACAIQCAQWESLHWDWDVIFVSLVPLFYRRIYFEFLFWISMKILPSIFQRTQGSFSFAFLPRRKANVLLSPLRVGASL